MSDQAIEAKKAIEDLNKGFNAFKDAQAENETKRDALIDDKITKIEATMDAAQKVADEAVLAAKRQQRVVTDANGNEVDLDAKALGWARERALKRGTFINEFSASELNEYKSAFRTMMRTGEEKMGGSAEIKALSVGSDPDGGYVVHPDMSGRVVERVFESSPMRSYASIQVISTDALEGLHDADEAGAEWVAETQTRAETDTPQLNAWRIPVHELSARPKATQKILDDAAINIEEWLANKVAAKFARAEASAFVNGDGDGKPRGFLTYADLTTPDTYQIGAIEQFDTGVNGGFAAAPDGGDVLIDALYGLKAQYRANATWFFNRSTTKTVRKLKDSDGAYLWAPGIAAGQPATLFSYPVAPFEDMPNIGTGSLSMAVGDMRAAYQIVERMAIRVLRDPFSAKPYVEFYTTKRVGGDVVDFDALKLVNFKA